MCYLKFVAFSLFLRFFFSLSFFCCLFLFECECGRQRERGFGASMFFLPTYCLISYFLFLFSCYWVI